MKTRFKIWTLGLVAVIAVSACAPAVPTALSEVETPAPVSIVPTPTSALSVIETPVLTVDNTPQPVATSRGPNLEATDPTTVALDSGGLQLVEFFRFT